MDKLVSLLAQQGREVRRVRRENPVGAAEYSTFVAAVGRIFRAAGSLDTNFRVLSLVAAAQYAVLLESQVIPALKNGEVIIAESWWAKTWARLGIEARRRGPLDMDNAESLNVWQRSLLPDDVVPSGNKTTVLVEAAECDRRLWYERAGCPDPVYDPAGNTSYEPDVYTRFTTEISDTLRSLAVSKDWPIVQNGADRSIEAVSSDLLAIVSKRLDTRR
ncbi:hypothetical protein ACFU6O_00495 [Streptomyces albidoflavus]